MGVLHDGLYKKWSTKLLRDFSDDIPEDKETEHTNTKDKYVDKQDITISGPLNFICPKIIEKMLKEGKNQQWPYV